MPVASTTKKKTVKKTTVTKTAKKKPVASVKKARGITKLKPDKNHVVIRMYNIGFGDCFLVQIPSPAGIKKVLIDCGVHFSGHNPDTSVEQIVQQVINDVTDDAGKPRIDVVIATHRHQDHVSGFADARWNDVEVGEVWLPWTENYKDPKAVDILKRQSTAGKKLQAALQLMISKPGVFGAKVQDVQSIKNFSENSLTNIEAMEMLHYGFKGGKNIRRQYLPNKERSENTFESKLLPGVTVHLMGPSRDPEVIRDMEPAANEQWFRLIDQIANQKKNQWLPFHRGWSKKPVDEDYGVYIDINDRDKLNAFKSILSNVSKIWDGTEFGVAAALDKAVNGTSLMFMFQIGNAYLLFPGDAQNGTWQSALKDEEWRDLLTRTNFYKVGHHGSHNATPKEFVFDVLQQKFKAMTSVYPVKAWKYIPKNELMKALQDKEGEIVRSDKPFDEIPDPASFTRTGLYVETKLPT